MIPLIDDVLVYTFSFLSVVKRDEKPSDLMSVALVCKRFYRLALQTLQRSGRTRSFDCFYELLDEIDTRCQVVRISYLDSISLDLSRFHSAYLEEISEACFAPSLKRLKISSNQPAWMNEEDIKTIKKFTNLKTLELNWFFHSTALLQLSSLSIIVVEPIYTQTT